MGWGYGISGLHSSPDGIPYSLLIVGRGHLALRAAAARRLARASTERSLEFDQSRLDSSLDSTIDCNLNGRNSSVTPQRPSVYSR